MEVRGRWKGILYTVAAASFANGCNNQYKPKKEKNFFAI